MSKIDSPKGIPRAPLEALPRQTRVEVTHNAVARQSARLEGKFQADLIHDVLVQAGANITASSTNVRMSDPKLIGSEVQKTKDGKLVVEDTIEVTLTIKSRRELVAFANLLDRARVENGELVLEAKDHQVTIEQPATGGDKSA